MSPTLLTPPTRSGLLPEARHLILPHGITSTGFPAVERTCAEIGIRFDDWQTDLNRCILGKDSTGDYAADTVLLSIARQVGKTFDVGALVFADSIIVPGTTTVWTAHRFKVSRETFNELRALARSPKLAPHIDYDDITSAAGNECIPFRNGSRIMFAARERGAIRGFTKVRRLVLDEAQILPEAALADMAPTMNQADNPQIIMMGTPPKPADPSEVFTSLRSEALEGAADGVMYAELSADPDADLNDREQWRKANPSFPRRTKEKAILRLRKLLGDDDFRREGLGIWDDDGAKTEIDMSRWAELDLGREDARPNPVAFAVEMSQSREWVTIGVVGMRKDGRRHLDVVKAPKKGSGWVIERLAAMKKEHRPVGIGVCPSGPAGSLIADMEKAGLEPTLLSTRDLGQATGMMLDGITEGTVAHLSQPLLSIAAGAAKTRKVSDAKVWDLRGSTDLAPLQAATIALFVLGQAPAKKHTGVVYL